MFTNYVSLLSIRGSLARSAAVSGTMSPSPGLLLSLALCCAPAAASAGGGQVEAVLQPTLVEAPVSLDTGSSKVTVTSHVSRYPLPRVTCHTNHIQYSGPTCRSRDTTIRGAPHLRVWSHYLST